MADFQGSLQHKEKSPVTEGFKEKTKQPIVQTQHTKITVVKSSIVTVEKTNVGQGDVKMEDSESENYSEEMQVPPTRYFTGDDHQPEPSTTPSLEALSAAQETDHAEACSELAVPQHLGTHKATITGASTFVMIQKNPASVTHPSTTKEGTDPVQSTGEAVPGSSKTPATAPGSSNTSATAPASSNTPATAPGSSKTPATAPGSSEVPRSTSREVPPSSGGTVPGPDTTSQRKTTNTDTAHSEESEQEPLFHMPEHDSVEIEGFEGEDKTSSGSEHYSIESFKGTGRMKQQRGPTADDPGSTTRGIRKRNKSASDVRNFPENFRNVKMQNVTIRKTSKSGDTHTIKYKKMVARQMEQENEKQNDDEEQKGEEQKDEEQDEEQENEEQQNDQPARTDEMSIDICLVVRVIMVLYILLALLLIPNISKN